MTTARNISIGKITLGSTSILIGSTTTSISGLTLNNGILTGSLTAGGSVGTSGYILQSTGTGVQWSGTLSALVLPSSGTTTTASQVGYMGVPQNNNPTSPYTIQASDNGTHIYITTNGIVSIPANSTLPLPIGFTFSVVNGPLATSTIQIVTDTLILANSATTGTRSLAASGIASFLKVTATSWIASGNGLT